MYFDDPDPNTVLPRVTNLVEDGIKLKWNKMYVDKNNIKQLEIVLQRAMQHAPVDQNDVSRTLSLIENAKLDLIDVKSAYIDRMKNENNTWTSLPPFEKEFSVPVTPSLLKYYEDRVRRVDEMYTKAALKLQETGGTDTFVRSFKRGLDYEKEQYNLVLKLLEEKSRSSSSSSSSASYNQPSMNVENDTTSSSSSSFSSSSNNQNNFSLQRKNLNTLEKWTDLVDVYWMLSKKIASKQNAFVFCINQALIDIDKADLAMQMNETFNAFLKKWIDSFWFEWKQQLKVKQQPNSVSRGFKIRLEAMNKECIDFRSSVPQDIVALADLTVFNSYADIDFSILDE